MWVLQVQGSGSTRHFFAQAEATTCTCDPSHDNRRRKSSLSSLTFIYLSALETMKWQLT